MSTKTAKIDPLLGRLPSTPPVGEYRVSNLYVDGQGRMVTEYDTDPTSTGQLVSSPPEGYFQVMNLYVNSAGKLVVQYEDTPV